MRSRIFHAFVRYVETTNQCAARPETISKLLRGTPVSAANLSPMKADKLGETHPFFIRMEEEIRVFVKEQGLDEESFIKKYYNEDIDPYDPPILYNSIPPLYKGFWVLVQLPSTYRREKDPYKCSSYRAAILRYERREEKAVYFSIFGRATKFAGHVRYLDNKLYYSAKEITRLEEKLFAVTLKAIARGDGVNEQHGVVMGVGHSEFDPEGRVYASKFLLRELQVADHEVAELADKLEHNVAYKRTICRYYSKGELSNEVDASQRSLEQQVIQAVRIFKNVLDANVREQALPEDQAEHGLEGASIYIRDVPNFSD
jgi:hypothetical protein